MNSIGDEIKESFRNGTAVVKLIYINLAVFLVVNLLYVLVFLMSGASREAYETNYLVYLMVHSDLKLLLYRPWTLLTYMFLHFRFLHILFNMLWLFWFGRIFLHYLTEKQLYTTYLLGGLSGAAIYILSFNVFPAFQYHLPMLGASAAVTAIIVAISLYNPNYQVNLMFIGPVKIIYIAIVFVLLDLLRIPTSGNAGGYISHLGGALYGYLFAMQLKKGKDIGKGFNKSMDAIAALFKPRSKMRVSYRSQAKNLDDQEYNRRKAATQKEVDKILDKIAKSGYESLSKREKEILFKMSNKS